MARQALVKRKQIRCRMVPVQPEWHGQLLYQLLAVAVTAVPFAFLRTAVRITRSYIS